MNEDQADMRDKLNQRRAMMNEDLEDILKTVPTKEEWVEWVMTDWVENTEGEANEDK